VARIVGLDVGERRVGLAISDPTGTLARPVGVVKIAALDAKAASAVLAALARHVETDEVIDLVVMGLPLRLDGSPSPFTSRVESFAAVMRLAGGYPVHLQDVRLTSREAESRLALREKDWRARKARLDAAAAAIILQDYLDSQRPSPGGDTEMDLDGD
jgi:putative Holliday junction resolvase